MHAKIIFVDIGTIRRDSPKSNASFFLFCLGDALQPILLIYAQLKARRHNFLVLLTVLCHMIRAQIAFFKTCCQTPCRKETNCTLLFKFICPKIACNKAVHVRENFPKAEREENILQPISGHKSHYKISFHTMWRRRPAAGARGRGGVERMQKLLKVKQEHTLFNDLRRKFTRRTKIKFYSMKDNENYKVVIFSL